MGNRDDGGDVVMDGLKGDEAMEPHQEVLPGNMEGSGTGGAISLVARRQHDRRRSAADFLRSIATDIESGEVLPTPQKILMLFAHETKDGFFTFKMRRFGDIPVVEEIGMYELAKHVVANPD